MTQTLGVGVTVGFGVGVGVDLQIHPEGLAQVGDLLHRPDTALERWWGVRSTRHRSTSRRARSASCVPMSRMR